jgi:hypothetical protein
MKTSIFDFLFSGPSKGTEGFIAWCLIRAPDPLRLAILKSQFFHVHNPQPPERFLPSYFLSAEFPNPKSQRSAGLRRIMHATEGYKTVQDC